MKTICKNVIKNVSNRELILELKTNQTKLASELEDYKSTDAELKISQRKLNDCNAQLKDVIEGKQVLQVKYELVCPWSEWSSCSKTCWGIKTRTGRCSNSGEQIKGCNQFSSCPRSVLVMDQFHSTEYPQSPPLLTDFQGNIQRELKLNFEKGTSVWFACGAVLNGEHWFIGGDERRQISRIDGCNAKRIGSLDSDFNGRSCNTYQFEVEKILFCFGTDRKECHLFDGKSVEKAKSTTFEHNAIFQLATYRGQPLTTGSQQPNHAKTEIMSLETGEWESGQDYPFYSMISNYGKASTDFAAYILGGAFGSSDRTSIIAEFRNNEWQKIGDLKEIKSDTSSIFHSGEYLIVGGDAQGGRSVTTEVWNFGTKTSRTINSFKDREYWNPILFLVDSDFCI